jgi:hypothetical protein
MGKQLHRLNSQHKNNTVTNFIEMGSLDVKWIVLPQHTVQWKVFAEVVTSL